MRGRITSAHEQERREPCHPVLGEQSHLKQVAAGKAVAVTVPQTTSLPRASEAPAKVSVSAQGVALASTAQR